jgi:threonine dehydratase
MQVLGALPSWLFPLLYFPMGPGVSLETIRAARAAVSDYVRVTPLWPSDTLSRIAGHPVSFKCEQLQRTGSFKLRGALNFVAQLKPEDMRRGLVAASAGNHAQGIAFAARSRGIDVTVVMPVFAPLAKANATRDYGARVVLHGNSLEDAHNEALAIAAREGRLYVPPFDDDAIISGQGTVALEILEQQPDATEIIVPAGGGGLLAGIAIAAKALRPDIRIVGVQAELMNGICRSFAAGHPVTAPPQRTIADGVAVAGPSQRTFDLISRHVDAMVSVGEDAIAHAIVLLLERSKMVVEGAGALGVAAIQSGAYKPAGRAVIVLSGGNIDINLAGSIVHRGLVDAGRYRRIAIEVSDTPGELALVAGVIAKAGGNILEVDHNRDAPGMPVGVAVLDLLLEINGPAHFDAIIAALRGEGLRGVAGSPARLATESARLRRPQ